MFKIGKMEFLSYTHIFLSLSSHIFLPSCCLLPLLSHWLHHHILMLIIFYKTIFISPFLWLIMMAGVKHKTSLFMPSFMWSMKATGNWCEPYGRFLFEQNTTALLHIPEYASYLPASQRPISWELSLNSWQTAVLYNILGKASFQNMISQHKLPHHSFGNHNSNDACRMGFQRFFSNIPYQNLNE